MQRTPPPSVERRADRRHALTGHARLVPQGGGAEWYGGIVDVGARGVRLRVRPGIEVTDGMPCHVWLEVSLPAAGPDVPPVRLHGGAVVLRRGLVNERVEEIALRFDEALRVGDAFATPAPGARSAAPVIA